ncbi:MAG TPA: DedA family protein [Candidatus Saccharimonadia bacterium]|jgi:membrane-associated protein
MHNFLNPAYVLELFGYVGLGAIVFAESGLLVGFFLPGDTLLIAAGILASHGTLNIFAAILLIIVSAIAGYSVGYAIGAKVGPELFKRQDSRFFSQARLREAHDFFEQYGAQSIILTRFIPVVRTFIPVVAGTSKMPHQKFFVYNVVGACLWGISVTMIGYTLGRVIPNIDTYILPLVLAVMVVSFIPALIHLKKAKTRRV